MAKISTFPLEELYERKITSVVEKAILEKQVFSSCVSKWCEKVCRLNCKNPPTESMFETDEVDVLIVQDYSAFDEPRFRKSGTSIERKHEAIIKFISKRTLGFLKEGKKETFTFALTNLVKCQIESPDIKKGKPPTDTVLSKCKPYLLEEIRLRKPKVIISLCTSVTKALGFKQANVRDCGDILSYNGIPVVLTLHPRVLIMLRQNSSGAAWGPDFLGVIERDFAKAAWLIRETNPLPIPNLDKAIEEAKKVIYIARSLEDVKRFCDLLTNTGLNKVVLSFDTETTGLDPFDKEAKIITMQFGFRNATTNLIDAYVFPMWHRGNIWYSPEKAWESILPILLNEDIKKVGHNLKFDMLYTEIVLGIRIRGVLFDTMLLLHAINSGLQGMYGLKRAVGNWLPDSGLQGYEEKLPKLTKRGKGKEDGVESEDNETEEGGED